MKGLGFLEGLGFCGGGLWEGLRLAVRVSVSFLTSTIMKSLKYGKTCVVLEGILCYEFLTFLVNRIFSHILKKLREYFRLMYKLFGK